MTVGVLLVLAVFGLLVAMSVRRRGDRAPKPGEGLRTVSSPVSDDMVVIRALDAPEAQVIRGLLASNGIPVGLVGADPDFPIGNRYPPQPGHRYRLAVPADRVAEAEALLSGEDVGADPGDVGTERP
jgi:hypothetical protein